jgi:hypothetical protein
MAIVQRDPGKVQRSQERGLGPASQVVANPIANVYGHGDPVSAIPTRARDPVKYGHVGHLIEGQRHVP